MFKSKPLSIVIVLSSLTAASAFAECPKDKNGKEVCPNLIERVGEAASKSGMDPGFGVSRKGVALDMKVWRNNNMVGAGFDNASGTRTGNFLEAGHRFGDSERRLDVEGIYGMKTNLVKEGTRGSSKEVVLDGKYALSHGYALEGLYRTGSISQSRTGQDASGQDVLGLGSPDLGFSASGRTSESAIAVTKVLGMSAFGFYPKAKLGYGTESYNLKGKENITGNDVTLASSHNRVIIGMSLTRNKPAKASSAQ